MMIQGDDLRLRPPTQTVSTARIAEVLRIGNEEVGDAVTLRPVKATEAAGEAELKTKPGRLTYDVSLIPGSTRLVTTIIDTETDGVLFRIPIYWSDVEATIEEQEKKVYA